MKEVDARGNVTEYVYELQEAITTMRDDIINTDDLISMIFHFL